jgi:hypothetical protein
MCPHVYVYVLTCHATHAMVEPLVPNVFSPTHACIQNILSASSTYPTFKVDVKSKQGKVDTKGR